MERTRMAIVVVGLNHTTAPVAVRERLAFSDATLAEALAHFRPPEVQELVILSTCNRVEMYMQTSDVDASGVSAVAFVAACHAVPPTQFTPHLYQLSDLEAVRHLFRVAASLDSLVLGEPQILGQVKAAYLAAQAAGRTGMIFSQLFERALRVAKTIRTETGISDHAVSVSYAAVELAKIFNLQQRTVMVLGWDTPTGGAPPGQSGRQQSVYCQRTSERAASGPALSKSDPLGGVPRASAYTVLSSVRPVRRTRSFSRRWCVRRSGHGAAGRCFLLTLPCRVMSIQRSIRWKTSSCTTSTISKTSCRRIAGNGNARR
jgi:hypothetical protein